MSSDLTLSSEEREYSAEQTTMKTSTESFPAWNTSNNEKGNEKAENSHARHECQAFTVSTVCCPGSRSHGTSTEGAQPE